MLLHFEELFGIQTRLLCLIKVSELLLFIMFFFLLFLIIDWYLSSISQLQDCSRVQAVWSCISTEHLITVFYELMQLNSKEISWLPGSKGWNYFKKMSCIISNFHCSKYSNNLQFPLMWNLQYTLHCWNSAWIGDFAFIASTMRSKHWQIHHLES